MEKKKETRITTSLRMSPADTKALKLYCLQNDTTVNDFLKFAADYCMEKKLKPAPSK